MSVFLIVAENTNTFTEDVVVDLVGGACDSSGFRLMGRSVGTIWDVLFLITFGTIPEVHARMLSCSVDVLVGLSTELVDVVA